MWRTISWDALLVYISVVHFCHGLYPSAINSCWETTPSTWTTLLEKCKEVGKLEKCGLPLKLLCISTIFVHTTDDNKILQIEQNHGYYCEMCNEVVHKYLHNGKQSFLQSCKKIPSEYLKKCTRFALRLERMVLNPPMDDVTVNDIRSDLCSTMLYPLNCSARNEVQKLSRPRRGVRTGFDKAANEGVKDGSDVVLIACVLGGLALIIFLVIWIFCRD